jgi:signal transduction histidine kinase
MMPRTIRGLIIMTGLAAALLTVVLGAATYYFANKSLVDELNTRIAVESRSLLTIGANAGVAGVAAAVRAREAAPSVGNLGYIVTDAQGRHVAGALRAALPPPGPWGALDYVRADGSRAIAQSLNSPIAGGGRLVVAADRSVVDQADGTVMILFGTVFSLILLFGFGSAWLLGRVVRTRLDRIATTAEAIMAGDLSRRMPIDHARGEFDQLSFVINAMLDRIEILLENLRRLSVGIAHDIRSPLSRARAQLEASERALDGLKQQDDVRASIREVDDVLDLLRALLGISEIEGFEVRKRFIPLDLGALADDVVDGYQPVVEAAGLSLALHGEPVSILGDPALLRRLIANLIDNAILYTPAGTHIALSVTVAGDAVRLTVSDDGPGVPEEERENIFGRFVRLDNSRSTPGHGLGLNLVAAVAKAHRGSARVVPSAIGLSIEITLPVLAKALPKALTA